jgi:Flp pilus assembly protein TadD
MATWNSTRSAILLSLARDQYRNGNFDKCKETLNEALRMDPTNAETHVLLAKVSIEQGQLEVAEQELAVARQLDPKQGEADYLSGVIYQRWQQMDKALSFYQTACDKVPTELAYVMAKAETLVAMDRQSEALALLQGKVIYFEHSPVIRDAVGMLLLQQHQTSAAVDMFRRASILGPDDLTVREHLATALFQDGKCVEAADILTFLISQDDFAKRAELRLMLAECQLAMGRPTDARITVQTASDLEPSSAVVWLTAAKVSLELNDTTRAEMSLKRSLSLDPSSAEAPLLMGYLRLKQERYQDALTSFNAAANMNPSDSTSLCMIGYTLEKMNRPQEAEHYFQQALKLDPKDTLAHKFMADAGE